MCKCRPEVRTPWCGRRGCEAPPTNPSQQEELEKIITIAIARYADQSSGFVPVKRIVDEAVSKIESLSAQREHRLVAEALQRVQEQVVLHYYDTTVGRKIDEFIQAQLPSNPERKKHEQT